MKSKFGLILLMMSASAVFQLGFADDAAPKFDLVTVCKTDCPKATTNDEAHACAEKLGRLNKSFRKSTCYVENEKYEEMIAKPKEGQE